MSELIDKWERIGFLDGVSNKEELCEVYENVSKIFMKEDERKKLINLNEISTMIFAIIYQFNEKGVTFYDDEELYTLVEKLNDGYEIIKDLHCNMTTLELEAEFCHSFVNEYVK